VAIDLAPRHPFMPPTATLQTPVFHPNVFESGVVCMGSTWLPSEGMDLFVRRLVRLLAFDPLLVNTRSVANSTALAWYARSLQQHPSSFPSDPVALHLGLGCGENSPTPAKLPTTEGQRVLRPCAHCQASLRLPSGRTGLVQCPRCRQDFEVQT
jgi:hypothetical protein